MNCFMGAPKKECGCCPKPKEGLGVSSSSEPLAYDFAVALGLGLAFVFFAPPYLPSSENSASSSESSAVFFLYVGTGGLTVPNVELSPNFPATPAGAALPKLNRLVPRWIAGTTRAAG